MSETKRHTIAHSIFKASIPPTVGYIEALWQDSIIKNKTEIPDNTEFPMIAEFWDSCQKIFDEYGLKDNDYGGINILVKIRNIVITFIEEDEAYRKIFVKILTEFKKKVVVSYDRNN